MAEPGVRKLRNQTALLRIAGTLPAVEVFACVVAVTIGSGALRGALYLIATILAFGAVSKAGPSNEDIVRASNVAASVQMPGGPQFRARRVPSYLIWGSMSLLGAYFIVPLLIANVFTGWFSRPTIIAGVIAIALLALTGRLAAGAIAHLLDEDFSDDEPFLEWQDRYERVVAFVKRQPGQLLATSYRAGPTGDETVGLTLEVGVDGNVTLTVLGPPDSVGRGFPMDSDIEWLPTRPVFLVRAQADCVVPRHFQEFNDPADTGLTSADVTDDDMIPYRSSPETVGIAHIWTTAIGVFAQQFGL